MTGLPHLQVPDVIDDIGPGRRHPSGAHAAHPFAPPSADSPAALKRRVLAVAALAVAGLLLASGVIGCGGGGDGAPSLAGPNSVVVADPNGALGAQAEPARALALQAIQQAAAAMPVSGVSVTLIPDAERTIGGWGLGGRTFGPTAVEIYIDPGLPDLARRLTERMPALVMHELHHAMRWRGPGYGRTLLEAMVSEGLADRFAVEVLGAPLAPWSDAFPHEQTDTYLDLARPEFDDSGYSHERWFFEAGLPQLPRWTGYTLGWRLVEAYQAAHPGRSAAALVDASAELFRPR